MVEENNRNESTDEQNFDVDIDKVYQNFIIEIDKIRSYVSVQSNPISLQDTNNIGSNVNVDKDPQESRCHAFYRLIGLPVVSTDGETLYCPGHDLPNNSNTSLNDAKTLIAQKISKDVFKLMDARENTPRDFLSIFSLQNVDASTLAMSSVEIRPFSSSLSNGSDDPFDVKSKNQSHVAKLASRLSKTVQDSSGNKATKVSSERLHILKPFIVDPRIDLSVTPNRVRLAVPFLKDKTETKLTDGIYLKRPYIEKICRERFKISPEIDVVGDHTKAVIESIKNDNSIKDQELIKTVFDPQLITAEKIQFANYINIIRSMLRKLSDAVDHVLIVLSSDPESNGQAEYNWIPVPDKRGPEYGSATRDVMTLQQNPFNQPKDNELIQALYKQEIDNINNKLKLQTKADLGGFAFDDIEITPDSNSSDAWGNKSLQAIEELKQRRKVITDQANSSLREIEIIMGEFSGLGLCDILAMSAALWIIDKSALVNLLDNTAVQRMLQDPNLQSSEALARQNGPTMTPKEALIEFETKVKQIFELMDAIYQDIREKNKR